MIVNSERLFSKLVIDADRPNFRIGLEDLHQLEAQVAREFTRLRNPITPNDVLLRRAAKKIAIVVSFKEKS